MAIEKAPPKGKRVLAWLKVELYPFVGYWDGESPNDDGSWKIELDCLTCDTYTDATYGEVVAWEDLPDRPNKNC